MLLAGLEARFRRAGCAAGELGRSRSAKLEKGINTASRPGTTFAGVDGGDLFSDPLASSTITVPICPYVSQFPPANPSRRILMIATATPAPRTTGAHDRPIVLISALGALCGNGGRGGSNWYMPVLFTAHMPVERVRRNRVSLLSRSRLRARPSVPDNPSVALLFRAHPRLP